MKIIAICNKRKIIGSYICPEFLQHCSYLQKLLDWMKAMIV